MLEREVIDTRQKISTALTFEYTRKNPETSVASVEQNWADWDEKAAIISEVTNIAIKIYNVLSNVPNVLGASKGHRFRSSITIPLRDYSMLALVSRDSNGGVFLSQTHRKFRWGNDPKGIPGYCATTKEIALIPDLQDPNEKLLDYWVTPHTTVRGGIIGIPMLNTFSDRSKESSCIGILTISTPKRGFFDSSHVDRLLQFSEKIKSMLLSNTDRLDRENGKRETLEHFFGGEYDTVMGKEQGNTGSYEDLEEILQDIISDLQENTRPGKKPQKAAQLLEIFKSAGHGGVSMDELYAFFDESPDRERRIASVISNLNTRYLKAQGIKIEGTVLYRLNKDPNKK